MSKKFSKDDLRKPDQFQAELIKGFQWTTAHSKMVLGVIGVFVVGAAIYGITSYTRLEAENVSQEKYYVVERQYTEKKTGFDQAQQQKEKPKDAKAKPPATPETPAVAASGDMQKDYGPVIEGFEAVIKDNAKSRGAGMAALNLSEIYLKYQKPQEALRVLQAVEPGLGNSEMLSALVLNQLGNVYANQNDCAHAVEQWKKITDNRKLTFAQPEAKLRMGLCYETLNETAKAEQLYTEASKKEESQETSASRDAEKYLRLLKLKKNNSGSGT